MVYNSKQSSARHLYLYVGKWGCGTAPGRCNGGPRGATVSKLISMRLLNSAAKNYAMTSPVAYNLGSLVAEKHESAL